MNPFEMVAIIVVAVMIASVLRAKYSRRGDSSDAGPQERAETMRLRVVEQIVTDGGAQTAAQIEALRDRARIESGDKVQ